MGKFYREFFYVPKYGKIRDKVVIARVALSVAVIVGCLAALSLSAYAWFACDVTSGANVIQTANFDVTVSVKQDDVPVDPAADGTYSLVAGTYSVSLTKTGTANTGFCVVQTAVGDEKTTFHTQQLGVDGETERPTLTFTLEALHSASVSFAPSWGTSLYYTDKGPLYIEDTSTVTVTTDAQGIVSGTTDQDAQEKPDEDPPVTPETDTPDTDTPDTPEQTENVHIVAEGEWLYMIAEKYNTTPDAIAQYNNLENKSVLQIGQGLKIPPVNDKN